VTRGISIALQSIMFARALLVAVAMGCNQAPPVSVVETTGATFRASPAEVDIAASPRGNYGGMTVYLYRDRWYYRDAQARWHYFVEEPDALREQRHFILARTLSGQVR
jgi:hypothetical protein